MQYLTSIQAVQLRAACANLVVILEALPQILPQSAPVCDAIEVTTAMRDIRRILQETEP